MVRGIEYWQQQIDEAVDAKDNIKHLLNNPSNVQFYKQFRDVFAVAANIKEQQYEQFKEDVRIIEETRSYGNSLWWIKKMKEFQYGDTVQLIEIDTPVGKQDIPSYAVIDESKQIIKFVAITRLASGASVLKVALDDGNGFPAVLDNSQLDAAKVYVDALQIAGANISVISLPSDQVKYGFDVYYNPQVIANDGSLISDSGVFPFEDAINEYHRNLRFDGTVEIEKVEDAIQKATGYVDHKRNFFDGKRNGGSYEAFDRFYTSTSGYVEIDSNFPLSDTINYIPDPNVL